MSCEMADSLAHAGRCCSIGRNQRWSLSWAERLLIDNRHSCLLSQPRFAADRAGDLSGVSFELRVKRRPLDKRTYIRERRRLDIARREEELRRSAWQRWRRTVVLPCLALIVGVEHEWVVAASRVIFGG